MTNYTLSGTVYWEWTRTRGLTSGGIPTTFAPGEFTLKELRAIDDNRFEFFFNQVDPAIGTVLRTVSGVDTNLDVDLVGLPFIQTAPGTNDFTVQPTAQIDDLILDLPGGLFTGLTLQDLLDGFDRSGTFAASGYTGTFDYTFTWLLS